jgi:1-acyl-sn-glycerol-3-phosphate acyltransferase
MRTEMQTRRLKNREIRAYRFFNRLLRFTLGRYLTWRYNMVGENLELLDRIAPPYLVLPNHTNFWDPFMVSSFVPHPVYYVTADANFRNPLMRFLLGLVGSIPKSKVISDLETVKHIVRIKQRKGVIGIFPEGRRSWDGHTLKLIYSTAKLVKLLKVPVIVPLLTGAYLSLPRWACRSRRGRLTISFRIGFTPQEIASLSADQIYERITHLLEYDEYDFQRRHMIPFRGRRRAEYLERTLFLCPRCRSIGMLRSHRDLLSCAGCGYTVLYNELGFLEGRPDGKPRFDTVRDWSLWQIERLRAMLDEVRERGSRERIFADSPVWLFRGYRSNPLEKLRIGTFALYPDRAVFYPLRGGEILFPLEQADGINVQNRERLELYVQSTLFRFKFISSRVSSYKWMLAMNILKGIRPDDVAFQA